MKIKLGYDADCLSCSTIAGQLVQVVGEEIEIVPLRSVRMQEWRREALGEDAPWAPTLVRLGEKGVEAWTGWRIASVLSRVLGPKKTWDVLGVLGSRALDGQPSRSTLGKISRSGFFKVGFGAIIGVGLLSKGATASAQSVNGMSGDVRPEQISDLHGRELIDAALKHLRSEDMENVVDPALLSMGNSRVGDAREAVPAMLKAGTAETGNVPPSSGEIEVFGKLIQHPGGQTETAIVLYQHEQKLFVHSQEFSSPMDDMASRVRRMHVEMDENDEPELKPVSLSVNGHIPTPVPESDLSTLAQDPCGGCGGEGPGSSKKGRIASQCNTSYTWSCIANLGGCAACTACGGWVACLSCAILSCTTLADSCCNGHSNICTYCMGQT
ncbi:hypothetical protein NOGI109294_02395 [Nocardiopsis gilva]